MEDDVTDQTNDAAGKKSDSPMRPPSKSRGEAPPEKEGHMKPQPIRREDAERNLPADYDPDDPVSP